MLRIWNPKTSECIKSIKVQSSVGVDLAFDPTGRYLVVGTALKHVLIIEALRGVIMNTFTGH